MLVSQASSAILVGSRVDGVSENPGISFGILMNSPELSFLLIILALSFLGWLVRSRSYLATPLALMLAGGVSNGLDRVVFGFVRDPLHIATWSGNLADFFIGIGMLWGIWLYVTKDKVGR